MLTIDEDQALWFRARRGFLAGGGASDEVATVRALLGAQSQQMGPSVHGIALRTAHRPAAVAVQQLLMESQPPVMVRTWGQRDTLHVYPVEDWPVVVAASVEWPSSGRRVAMPTEEDLAPVRERAVSAGRAVTRSDLFDLVSPELRDSISGHIRNYAQQMMKPGYSEEDFELAVLRFAAGRLLWTLAHSGDVAFGGKSGNETAYLARQVGWPDLPWDLPDARAAAVSLARRYLSCFAPATVQDLAHFFGSRVTLAREWVAALEPELAQVACGGRRGLLALAADADALREAPADDWPTRLLPMWDGAMMLHADKTWRLPEAEHKSVWKRAAVVAPTVVARGRIVATWTHKLLKRGAKIEVTPLSGWRSKEHLADVEREAQAFAAHHGVADAKVSVRS